MVMSSYNAEVKGVECHLHALMCSVTVVFIHTMKEDQRLNTLVHEGDTQKFSLQHRKKSLYMIHMNERSNEVIKINFACSWMSWFCVYVCLFLRMVTDSGGCQNVLLKEA